MTNTPGSRHDDTTDYGSTVRNNLMKEPRYTPYCGAVRTTDGSNDDTHCSMPRTRWDGEQFVCPCGLFRTSLDAAFIEAYKARWHSGAS